ncbi:MAG: hypothetical protein GHCLOJNM_02342 [bacterium]|nr:hypothetical protein [bacterium]
MALHPSFPESPHAILDPAMRWFPADEALRDSTMEKLMPPLVPQLRKKVKQWRDSGYVGATDTSKSLLNWWFNTPHLLPSPSGRGVGGEGLEEFRYYFAQREALETVIFLYDVVRAQDKFDLMRFDSSGAVSAGMFNETWRRFVVKMATGSGKTKVLRLVSGYDVLYPKVKEFVREQLFDRPVDLESPNTLRNLSELAATKTLIEAFKRAINALTVQDRGDAEIRDTIKLRYTRPYVDKDQAYLVPKKSVFNRIIGDSHFELLFARFLEDCEDVVAHAKNFRWVHFKLDYVNADGDISNYQPDFFVKVSDKEIFIVETKGREDLDVPLKMERLRQWCEDINRVQSAVRYDFVYVDEEGFEKYRPTSFQQLVEGFREYKEMCRITNNSRFDP